MRKTKVAQLASVFGGVAVAVSSVVASSAAMAESYGPKVYGRIDVAIENAEIDDGTGSNDVWSIESHSSRLGVKGEEELMHGLTAIYQYEIEIQPEEQSVGSTKDNEDFLKSRNQFVGLKGEFGTLRIGRIDTPLKKAQGKVDLFVNHFGEIDKVFAKDGENRIGDTINYTTPTFADAVTAQLALIQGEGDDTVKGGDIVGDLDGDGSADDGLGDGVSANVIYKQNNLFLAAAIDSDVKGKDAWRIVGQFKIDAITLGALYQVAEENTANPNERSGFILNAAYDLDGTVFKAQYGDTENEDANGNTLDERSQITLGIHKNYSKTTTLYAEVSDYELENVEDILTFSTGIRKKF